MGICSGVGVSGALTPMVNLYLWHPPPSTSQRHTKLSLRPQTSVNFLDPCMEEDIYFRKYQILRTEELWVKTHPFIMKLSINCTSWTTKKNHSFFKYKFKITCFEIISPAEDYITCKCRLVNIQVI